MFQLDKIIRPHILTLTPYSSARDEYTGTVGVFLDANENPIGSVTGAGPYNRYPDPHQEAIRERLATLKNLKPEQVFLGNGSDEAIDLLVRATCQPGHDEILIMPPTYGMYEVSAAINDVRVVRVPLTADFQIDTIGVLSAVTERTKLIFVCSPNNPSGNLLSQEAIRAILEKAKQALVVVDEAYIDFAGTPSWTTQLAANPNLVVLQTFSKAWGLAGLRLGMAFASAELIGVLMKIKPPYNISGPTQQLALQALGHVAEKDAMVAEILTQRQALTETLLALPHVQAVHPSDANFLLVAFDDAASVFRYLIAQQVIVRDRSSVKRCEGCLRITVGTAAENRQLIQTLQAYKPQRVAAGV